MLIWGCHGFCSSYIFVLFLFSCHPIGYTSRTRPNISTWRPSTTEISAGYHWFLREISGFGICVRSSQTCGISTVLTTNNRADFSTNDLLFFCYLRNNVTTGLERFIYSGLLSTCHLEYRSHKTMIKWAKQLCVYYSNSSATFHCLLVGDLVFKLNPGPLNSGYEQSSARRLSRNSSNLITVHRQPYNGSSNAPLSLCLINSPSASSLKFCLLNSRSVRNKTGDLVDYIVHDGKPDIVAITESWLGQHDDAVRVELCPVGYNLLDHTLRDLLESVGLRQHVKKSTHNNGHILDLIITRFTDSTISKEPQVDRFISDHSSVICHVLASRPSKARRKITYQKLNSVDTDKLRRDVAASVLCNTVRVDPEDLPVGKIDNLVRECNLTLKNITDHHAPLKTKVLRPTNQPTSQQGIVAAQGKAPRSKTDLKFSSLCHSTCWVHGFVYINNVYYFTIGFFYSSNRSFL